MQKITEAIHAALVARNVSVRKVHLATGLERATIKRFIDTCKAHSDTLDAIGEFLGVKLMIPPPANEQPKRKAKSAKGSRAENQ